MASDKVVVLGKENFNDEVLKSDKPVVVDFWAKWCSPCLAIAPIIEELAEHFDGRLKVCKLNIDDENEIASKYRVMSIPTLILFKDGEVVDKIVGAHVKQDFIDFVDGNI